MAIMNISKRGSHSAGIRTQGQKLTNISKMADFPHKGFGGGKAGDTMDTPEIEDKPPTAPCT